jgi:GntR family transcriptional regulator
MNSPSTPVQALAAGPLDLRARDALLQAIRDDKFPDGRLPPEEQLAELLGISRGTLRSALQSLSADGVISRRRRSSTVINHHVLQSTMPLNRLVPFTQLIEQSGWGATSDPQEVRTAAATPEQAAALGISDGEPVAIARRLLRADGQPVITVTDIVAVSRLTVPANEIRGADTTFDLGQARVALSVVCVVDRLGRLAILRRGH